MHSNKQLEEDLRDPYVRMHLQRLHSTLRIRRLPTAPVRAEEHVSGEQASSVRGPYHGKRRAIYGGRLYQLYGPVTGSHIYFRACPSYLGSRPVRSKKQPTRSSSQALSIMVVATCILFSHLYCKISTAY